MLFSYHFPHALARVDPSFVLQIVMIHKEAVFCNKGVNIMSTLKADSNGKTASSLLFTNGCSHQSYRPLVRPEQLFQVIHLFFNVIWHLLQHLLHQHHHDRQGLCWKGMVEKTKYQRQTLDRLPESFGWICGNISSTFELLNTVLRWFTLFKRA